LAKPNQHDFIDLPRPIVENLIAIAGLDAADFEGDPDCEN
jgi:hypothetical protein